MDNASRSRSLLTVDIGNSSTKASIFEDEEVVFAVSGSKIGFDDLRDLMLRFEPEGTVCCRVGEDKTGIIAGFQKEKIPFLEITPDTALPIEVCYGSRSTLGADRVAAAVGGVLPGDSALVVDAGTALTCDLVIKGSFAGGNISPGLWLRFKALNLYTSKLPLVSPEGDFPPFGHDTESAIRSGVVGGLVSEIIASFKEAQKIEKDIKMVLTGGDAAFLRPLIAREVGNLETVPDAVGLGMVRIYNYNNK